MANAYTDLNDGRIVELTDRTKVVVWDKGEHLGQFVGTDSRDDVATANFMGTVIKRNLPPALRLGIDSYISGIQYDINIFSQGFDQVLKPASS